MRPTSLLKRVSVCALIAAAGWSMGCNQEDQVEAELRRADVLLSTLTVGGYTPIADRDRKREDLQWVINRLTGKPAQGVPKSMKSVFPADLPASVNATASEIPSQKAAANLLVGRAQAGLAEMHAQEQQDKEEALLNQIEVIRSGIGEFTSLSALAKGLTQYDPASDVAALEAQIEQRRQELARQTSAKAALDAKIADLHQRSQHATDEANTARARESELRAQMNGVSETRRAELLEQATQVKRSADALEVQAANLLAEAAKEEPEASTVESRVALANQQISLLQQAIADSQERARRNGEGAQRTLGQAQQAAQRVEASIAEAKGLRSNADNPASDALRLYAQALASAKQAVGAASDAGTKTNANGASGSYAQATGDIHAARARGLSQFAAVLNSAASGQFPLPQASSYKSDSQQFASQAAEARKAAMEAYGDAIGFYEKAGFKERAEQVKSKLESLRKMFDDTAPAPAPADEAPKAEANAAADTPGADFDKAAVEAEIRAALKDLSEQAKSGDTSAAMSHVEFADADEGAFFSGAAPLAAAMQSLSAACQEKYGKPLGALIQSSSLPAIQQNPMMMMVVGMASAPGGGMMPGAGAGAIGELASGDVPITVTAPDKAEIGPGLSGQPIRLVKKDGVWKAQLPRIGLLDSPMFAAVKKIVPAMGKMAGVAGEVEQGVRASTYSDADAMLVDLSTKLTGAMAGLDGGG